MYKLISAIKKEVLVLIRDKAGLAILFLMPMMMIFVITMVQDFAFQSFKETKIRLVLLDNDKDSLGVTICNGLKKSNFFDVSETLEGKHFTEELVKKSVATGTYQVGIIIPANSTKKIRRNAQTKISQIFMGMGMNILIPKQAVTDSVPLTILFDPVIKSSFKNSIISTLDKFTSKIEAKVAFSEFGRQLSAMFHSNSVDFGFEDMSIVKLDPKYASASGQVIVPNSVQHNVPAWTMFAMFFLVIPLAGNLIKERDDGSLFRLMTMPGSYFKIFSGKVVIYLAVCLIQCLLMILTGVYLLPLLGLPKLVLGSNFLALIVVAFSAALAAVGFGIAVGIIFRTHQQAASFGSISVIIMAALGGVWVPVHFMPQVMQQVATFSPLNWGLNGFYNIFLRNANVAAILPDSLKLLAFFTICIGIAYASFNLKYRS